MQSNADVAKIFTERKKELETVIIAEPLQDRQHAPLMKIFIH